jgi:hypothetical protein
MDAQIGGHQALEAQKAEERAQIGEENSDRARLEMELGADKGGEVRGVKILNRLYVLRREKVQPPGEIAHAYAHSAPTTPQLCGAEVRIRLQDVVERRGKRDLLRDTAATLVTAMERKLREDTHDRLDHPLVRAQRPWRGRRWQTAARQEAGDKGHRIALVEGLVCGKACGTGSVEWEWLPILKQSLIQTPVQFSRDPYVVEILGRMGICMPYVVYPINASRVFVRALFYIQIA